MARGVYYFDAGVPLSAVIARLDRAIQDPKAVTMNREAAAYLIARLR
jgi:hypothetical protein